MTSFVVGQRYSRDQVRAELGLPPMSGGDWPTGYARFGDEVFVFCNIGVAGRTGHDYPNRWVDNALDWFGKTGSSVEQPLIGGMVSGALTSHIFWRGRDRAPFIYAGEGIAQGAWGEKPVEVLWRFRDAVHGGPPAKTPPSQADADPQAAGFRHGPAPSFGFKRFLASDGECFLYVMVLDGPMDAIFPSLRPQATGRSIIKVGISSSPRRRVGELNSGFPRGCAARWTVHNTKSYPTAGAAYDSEGVILQHLADSGCWIGGEFAIVDQKAIDQLLG